METINDLKSKANKDHRCDFCFEKINKGEIYNRQTNTDNGEIYTFKTHIKCFDVAQKLNMFEDSGEGVNGDMFCEYINEEYKNIVESVDIYNIPFKNRLDAVCDEQLKEINDLP